MVSNQLLLLQPIQLRHNQTSIVASVTISVAGNESLASTPCPPPSSGGAYFCYEESEVNLNAAAYLIDTYNGWGWGSNSWPGFSRLSENTTYCLSKCSTTVVGGSGGAFSAKQSFKFYVNVSGAFSNDTFEFEILLTGGVLAEMDALGTNLVGGSATATLNFASLGNGMRLNYISYIP
ncbi:MAG: hypothetical protein L3K19_00210 [Thermoplasmata archaeon]|nr:hypothetical protein [Thermoplasmata archaeon]